MNIKLDKLKAGFLKRYLATISPADGFCTHGPLTVETLIEMLLDDVIMTTTRPGCWEASNMAQVLISHGYKV
jgi:hypothetical protein